MFCSLSATDGAVNVGGPSDHEGKEGLGLDAGFTASQWAWFKQGHSEVTAVTTAETWDTGCVPATPLPGGCADGEIEAHSSWGPGLRVIVQVRVRGRTQTLSQHSVFMHTVLAKRGLRFKNHILKTVTPSLFFFF